jgi:SAM-dependent methyltransferase
MLLQPQQRKKLDESEDTLFYSFPRLVTHVDNQFINQLTQLYRQKLKPNSRILDLMSSWVSHLPSEMEFAQVEGHGLNEEELAQNERLNDYFVQNLNVNPQLPFPDRDFDAVLCAVSVQYLQYPEAVFKEICRILKPNGIAIVSFSNRMFYQKAISAWRDHSDNQRIDLVKSYFNCVSGFSKPEEICIKSEIPSFLQMFGMVGADPFYAIYAYKNN